MSERPVYAPLPARAMVDMRLAERHLRTLAVVAAHDRLGKNGIGCWASHQRLAAMVGCHYTRISHNLKELGELGYIERVEHPLNKRLRVYKVIYTDADARVMKATAKAIANVDSCPDGQVSVEPIVAQSDNPEASIVAHQNQEVAVSIEEPPVNIFPEGGKILRETLERNSAEAAPLCSGASTKVNIGGYLARFERAMKEGSIRDVGNLQRWHGWLQELFDTLDVNDPNQGRANRLLEQVDWPEEVYSPTVGANGAAQGAVNETEPDVEAGASSPNQISVDEPTFAEMFPRLYDAFEPSESPWDPTPGNPAVFELLCLADENQHRQASAVLARKGIGAAAEWIKANIREAAA